MKYSRIIIGITVFTLALSLFAGGFVFAFTGPTLPAGQGGGTLQLDGSGNIGFGTNLATPTGDPTNAVFGRVFTIASTSDPGIALRNLSIGGGKYIIYSRANGRFVVWDDVAIRPRFFIESNGNVGISGNSTSFFTPSSTLHVAGSVQTEGAFVGQLAPSSITGGAFQVTNYAFPSALGVGTSSIAGLPTGGLYVAGNVGIGTKSPGVKLHLYDAINNAQIKLESDGSDDSSDILIDRPNSQRRSDIYFTTADVTDWVIGTLYNGGAANSKFSISSDSTLANSKFVIDTNGNVGIGTTSPAAKLDIDARNTGSYGTSTIRYVSGDTGGAWNAATTRYVKNASQDQFEVNIGGAATSQFTVQNAGNVGIGTTGPGRKLEVYGDGQTVGLNYPTASSYGQLGFYEAGVLKGYVQNIGSTWAEAGRQGDLELEATGDITLQTTNGNVGIGTATPGQKLSVAGVIESTTGGIKFPDGSIQLTAGGGGNSVGWSRTGTYVTLTTTTDWVAIGTTTPTQALHVQGNAYVSGNITTGGTMTTNVGASNVSAGTFGYTAGKGNYTFEGAATTNSVLKVDATNERVGIGTGSPMYTMQIGQNTAGIDTNYGIGILRNGTNVTPGTYDSAALDILDWAGDGPTSGIDGVGMLAVRAGRIADGDTYASNASLVKISNDSGGAMRIDGKRNTFIGYMTDAASTQTAGLFVNGNVGVGTTAPLSLLHVQGSVPTLILKDTNVSVLGGTFGQFDIRGSDGSLGGSDDIAARIDAYDDIGTYGDRAAMRFYTNDSSSLVERMRITSAGNVGIGTTSPAVQLEVQRATQGIVRVSAADSPATYYTEMYGWYDSANLGGLRTSQGNLIRYSSTNAATYVGVSDAVTIKAGNVGIGTTTPAYKLDVTGDIRATGNIISGGTMTANVGAGNVSAGTFGITAGKGNYTFEAAASTNNVLKVDATNERVGVGESGPTTALDVKKDVPAASGTAPILLVGNKSGNWGNYAMIETRNVPDGRAVRFGSYLGSSSYAQGGFAVVTGVNGDIASTPTTKFFVRHDGNVGIGTVSPTAYLHVRGDASAQPIMVKFENSGNGNYLGFANQYGASNRMAITQNADLKITLGESGGVGILTGSADIPSGVINLNGNVGIGTTAPTGKLFIGSSWRTTHGGTDLYVSNTGNGPYNTSTLGLTYSISDPTTTGPTKPGFILYNDDTTAGGWSPMLLFSKAESGTSPYKATMAGIAARAPLGTGDGDSWIDGELHFYVAGAATQGLVSRMVINKDGHVGIATTSPSYKLDVSGTGRFLNPVFVGSPTDVSHATTKSYVDSLVTGGATSGNLATLIVTGTTTLASTAGKVTIGGAGPSLKLDVIGQGQLTDTLSATKYYDYNDPTYYIDPANTGTALKLGGSIQSDGSGTSYVLGNTLIGTASNPGSYKFAVSGTSYFSNQVTVNANLLLGTSQNITLQTGNITGVNKITAAIIDPLYEIDGKKYATYGAAIAGGLYEEYIGRGNLQPTTYNLQQETTEKNSKSKTLNPKQAQNIKSQNGLETAYEYVIDFNKVERGSDLWLWYQVVDFGEDTVQAIVTPIGESANIYYEIQGKKIIFKTHNPQPTTNNEEGIKFSFRLSGKRHDYKEWPTEAKDQKEKASFILKAK